MRTTCDEIKFLCVTPKDENSELDYSNSIVCTIKNVGMRVLKPGQFAIEERDLQKVNNLVLENGFEPKKCNYKIFENIDDMLNDNVITKATKFEQVRRVVEANKLIRLKDEIKALKMKSWSDEQLKSLTSKLQAYVREKYNLSKRQQKTKKPASTLSM